MPIYDTHVFVCENERDGSDPRGCCASRGSRDFTKTLKELCKKGGVGDKKVRVNKAGCLDLCAQGPVVVVYPEGIWYCGVTVADAKEIYEEHVLGGRPVERLRIPEKAARAEGGGR